MYALSKSLVGTVMVPKTAAVLPRCMATAGGGVTKALPSSHEDGAPTHERTSGSLA